MLRQIVDETTDKIKAQHNKRMHEAAVQVDHLIEIFVEPEWPSG